jgi:hypothetical protein
VAQRFPSAGEMARALADALGAAAPTLGGEQRDLIDEPTRKERRRDPAAEAAGTIAMTRGVVFRGVSGVLGVGSATSWMHAIERDDSRLADALSLRTSPTDWLPADRFHDLLAALGSSGHDPQAFARELGSHVAGQSLLRFHPSGAEGLSPDATIGVVGALWRRYHSWGELSAAQGEEHGARVLYRGPREQAICAFIEGWLEQALAMSGGLGARVVHTRCASLGDEVCEFAARWSRPPRA